MPEIRLGNGENMSNINLGSIEMQEVYLGNVLVWRNNLPPVYNTVSWDGNSFTTVRSNPGMDDETMAAYTFTPGTDTFAGQVNGNAGSGATESRNISIVIGSIHDPDNVNTPAADQQYVVGYRLQRPDNTYAAGDPASTGNRADGASIAEFGQPLPGQSYTFANGEFTGPASARGTFTSTLSTPIRATDSTGTIVDSSTQEFVDDGNWRLIVIDSLGGESEVGTINVTLDYQAPSGAIVNNSGGAAISTNSNSPTSFTNATIGGPSTVTLRATDVAGPVTTTASSQHLWSCVSGCSNANSTAATYTVNIPQNASGGATPARVRYSTLGRSWFGNNITTRTTYTDVYFRSGAACSAGYSVGDGSYSVSNGCAQYGGTLVGSGMTTISCSGSYSNACSGFSGGSGRNYSGSFGTPNPSCSGAGLSSGPLPTATVRVSGGSVSIGGSTIGIGTGSRTYTASGPAARYTCNVTAPTGDTNVSSDSFRSSTTCDTSGIPASISVSSSSQCRVNSSGPGGPACGTATNPSRVCGSFNWTCSSIPRNGSQTGTVTSNNCVSPSHTAPNTTVSASGGTFQGQGVVSNGVVCIAGTIGFSGNATHRWGGSLSLNCTCTGAQSGTTWSIRRNTGTSGNGPGSWTDQDFGTDCDSNFGSRTPGESVSCSCTVNAFISGWGNVTVSGPSFSGTVG